LLDAEYHVYTHTTTGLQQIGCHSYSVPAHVQEHVDLIKPTVHFTHHVPESPAKKKRELKKRFGGIGAPSPDTGPKTNGAAVTITASLETCDEMSAFSLLVLCGYTISHDLAVTPDCLRALYAVNYTPVATDRNTFGISACNDLCASDSWR
jgi:tripeptidyl-peptidase I